MEVFSIQQQDKLKHSKAKRRGPNAR